MKLPPSEECKTAGEVAAFLGNLPPETPVVLWDETGSWETGYMLFLPAREEGPAIVHLAFGEQLDTSDDRVS